MGLNLAIVLGITNYQDTANHLPACKNDIEAINKTLISSGRFSNIHIIPSEDGKNTKAYLAELVEKYKSEDIDELFFYFTGHGDFKNDEFRYLLRDYSTQKPAQTSISNSELDTYLRNLAPSLVIKVVDACHSGMPYIKDGTSFSDYMKAETESHFSKCYFLFSSQSDQQSWATSKISSFTKIFVESVSNSSTDTIRYKDIIDYISDSFQSDIKQHPLFVVQGNFTEIFGIFEATSRKELHDWLLSCVNPNTQTASPVKASLAELAKSASRNYVSMETAIDAVSKLKLEIENTLPPPRIIELFNTDKIFFTTFGKIPKKPLLGKWLTKEGEGYFASPTYSTQSYEVDSPLSGISGMFGGLNSATNKKITKTREVISGIQTSIKDLPFCSALITFNPTLPNLTKYGAWITFFISKQSIQTFTCLVEYKEVAWDSYIPDIVSDWKPSSFSLSQFDAKEIISIFRSDLDDFIATSIAAKLGVTLDESNAQNDIKLLSAPINV